jgi:hypothetical protein
VGRLRDSRSQSRMWTAAIVMAHVLAKDSLNMAFVERNEKVQALAPDSSDQPFAIRIGDRRLLHLKVTLRRDVSG